METVALPADNDLHRALLAAFPTAVALEQMVEFGLGENPAVISLADNLADRVFKLIRWAHSRGRVKELIGAAVSYSTDAGDLRNWAEQLGISVELARPPCPYPGMVPFQAHDARFFYGRDEEIKQMLRRLRRHNFLLVIGPSGSGKSSLVFAGLLPQLQTSSYWPPGSWHTLAFRTGATPLASLTASLGGDLADPATTVATLLTAAGESAASPPTRLLLVVDQFEELFTLAQSSEQGAFIAALQSLRALDNCAIILTMRADFYPDLMQSDLWPVEPSRRLEIAPLRGAALEEAILKPARQVGIRVERELLDKLLADAASEPGSLPLLQETLVLLWNEMSGRVLTREAYQRLGGTHGSGLAVAVSSKADSTLANLSPPQQSIARRIFLRLVQFGEGRPDTRRRQPLAALRTPGEDPASFDRTLKALTDARLLTTAGEGMPNAARQVDIAHEVLIHGWPDLRTWIEQRREAEQHRRRLEAKATDWVGLGSGAGGLLDTVELAQATKWLHDPDAAELGVSADLAALIDASRDAVESAALEREAEILRQIEQAQALARAETARATAAEALATTEAERASTAEALAATEAARARTAEELTREILSSRRRTRRFAAWLALLSLAALVAACFAWLQTLESQRQARRTEAERLALLSEKLRAEFPQRGLLLAVEAVSTTMRAGEAPPPSAEVALQRALNESGGQHFDISARSLQNGRLSPDGRWLIAGDGARLWLRDNWASGAAAEPRELPGPAGRLQASAFSADGRWLATSRGRSVSLWDLTAAGVDKPGRHLTSSMEISHLVLSPDGATLVSGNGSTLQMWNLGASSPLAPRVLGRAQQAVTPVVISPGGKWLVSSGSNYSAHLWSLVDPTPEATPLAWMPAAMAVFLPAISSNGRWLVLVSRESRSVDWMMTGWDLQAMDAELLGTSAHPAFQIPVELPYPIAAISDSGEQVAVTGGGEVLLWNLGPTGSGAVPTVLPEQPAFTSLLSFSPDGLKLLCGDDDMVLRIWDLGPSSSLDTPLVLRGAEDRAKQIGVGAGGHQIVALAGKELRSWNLRTAGPVANPRTVAGVLSSAGHARWRLVQYHGGPAEFWDLSAEDPLAAAVKLPAGAENPRSIALSSDSQWLATLHQDALLRLWRVGIGAPRVERAVPVPAELQQFELSAISTDGRWLVAERDELELPGTAQLRLLDLQPPEGAIDVFNLPPSKAGLAGISPGGRWLLTYGEEAQLWDLAGADPASYPRSLPGTSFGLADSAFSPGGDWLVTTGGGAAQLWDLRKVDPALEPIKLVSRTQAVSFSSDQRWLVTASHLVQVWDMSAPPPGQPSYTVTAQLDNVVAEAALSPGARWVVAATPDGIIQLWNVKEWDPRLLSLNLTSPEVEPSGSLDHLGFSLDGRWLLSTLSSSLNLWRLDAHDLVSLACRTAGRNLSDDEWQQDMRSRNYQRTCPGLPDATRAAAPSPEPGEAP